MRRGKTRTLERHMDLALGIEKVVKPIGEQFCPAAVDEVRRIEEVSGSSLPPVYVSFLTTIGNCMFSGSATVHALNGEKLSVSTMFGVSGPFQGILEDLKWHEDYVAAKLVPIADNHFNDRYVLESATGKVLYIEYKAGTNRVIQAADTFEDFLRRIRVEPC